MNLLTADEVAGQLRVNPETVRTWARTGVLRGSKVGSAWRFYQGDIDGYLAGGQNVSEDHFNVPAR